MLATLPILSAQTRTWPTPLQATLDVPLDSRRMQKGSPVFASATYPWHGPDCDLKAGATIAGHIVDAQARPRAAAGEARLAVLFETADCNGQRSVPLTFKLFAVVDTVDDPAYLHGFSDGVFGSMASHALTGTGGTGGFIQASPGEASAAEEYAMKGSATAAGPTSVSAGQVIGVSQLKLSVGTAADGASVLSSKRDFRIGVRAGIVLLAQLPSAQTKLSVRPAAESHPALLSARVKPSPTPIDPTEICSAGTCSVADDPSSSALAQATGGRTVSLNRLGYRPRVSREIRVFDNEATLSFLSPRQLLVTFDAHHLRLRDGDSWPRMVQHTVRAALLDAQSGTVERVEEWTVDGTEEYLWPLGDGRVLVHMGSSLVEYGPDLKKVATIPASGELLWVTSSPSGREIAFALVSERHTRAVHDQIASMSSLGPEEDIEIRLVDESGHQLLSRVGTSLTPPLILTDSGGEVVTKSSGGQRWKIEQQGSGLTVPIATVNSDCAPRISTNSPGTLFVLGCSRSERWYRILRMNGRTLLKGQASSQEIEQSSLGDQSGQDAVRVVDLTHSMIPGSPIHDVDLLDERIMVHRESDGRRLMVAAVKRFPDSRSSFALASDGSQLALLTDTGVRLYHLTR